MHDAQHTIFLCALLSVCKHNLCSKSLPPQAVTDNELFSGLRVWDLCGCALVSGPQLVILPVRDVLGNCWKSENLPLSYSSKTGSRKQETPELALAAQVPVPTSACGCLRESGCWHEGSNGVKQIGFKQEPYLPFLALTSIGRDPQSLRRCKGYICQASVRNTVKHGARSATVPIARHGGNVCHCVSVQGVLPAVVCLCQSLGCKERS